MIVLTWYWIAIHVAPWTDSWHLRKHVIGEPYVAGNLQRVLRLLVRAVVLLCSKSDLVPDGRIASNSVTVERLLVEDHSTESAMRLITI